MRFFTVSMLRSASIRFLTAWNDDYWDDLEIRASLSKHYVFFFILILLYIKSALEYSFFFI
jgi:hypothetical protein